MKVLIANRGEIAIRILRTCRELGLASVAVYSDADQLARHARYADEAVCIGSAKASESYLNIEVILEAAHKTGADAIHPGYGFLSENATFARAVESAGMVFVGPRSETIGLTGDKLAARRAARSAGLPVLPGPDEPLPEEIPAELAGQVTFPVLIKAVQGGGGRGIRLANSAIELEQMVTAARNEAMAAFGDATVYLEPLVQQARHIEVQILGDGHGGILCLGERECSIQRRRQKLIEEAPAPGLSDLLRFRLYEQAIHLGESLKYRSLGTVEYLLDQSGHYYFIEVNPRIQVEHPVTEMVTGIDLVRAQLQLAAGLPMNITQNQVKMEGWGIEARILAEDPEQGFMPATGEITQLELPGGPGIRVDTALFVGMPVTTDYDSLIAKVIAWGKDRTHAIRRLKRALEEFQVGGISTDVDFLMKIIDSSGFEVGWTNTTYLDTFQPGITLNEESLEKELALAAAMVAYQSRAKNNLQIPEGNNLWRSTAWREQMRRAD
jgi:acetyl-CoA carboxylase, biotin carboxylase subunit